MATLVLNKPFPTFYQTFNQGNSVVRKQNRREFDQVIPQVIPTVEKSSEYKNAGYLVDSFSQIISNQSLSPEQIAKGQTKAIDEKLEFLSRTYEISKFEVIKNFLSKNRFLIPLLEEIPNKIYEYYGNGQKILLEVFYEPDFPQSSKLWVSVLTELSAEEARSIMDKIDGGWWLDNIDRAKCKLNIGIDYV